MKTGGETARFALPRHDILCCLTVTPHFSQEIVTRCQRCPWMQGVRPKPTKAYCMYVEESEGVQRWNLGDMRIILNSGLSKNTVNLI